MGEGDLICFRFFLPIFSRRLLLIPFPPPFFHACSFVFPFPCVPPSLRTAHQAFLSDFFDSREQLLAKVTKRAADAVRQAMEAWLPRCHDALAVLIAIRVLDGHRHVAGMSNEGGGDGMRVWGLMHVCMCV